MEQALLGFMSPPLAIDFVMLTSHMKQLITAILALLLPITGWFQTGLEAFASEPEPFFLSVRDSMAESSSASSLEWQRSTCAYLHNVTTLVKRSAVKSRCAAATATGRPEAPGAGYRYHLHLERGKDGSLRLEIENLAPSYAFEVTRLTRVFAPTGKRVSETDREIAIQKTLRDYFARELPVEIRTDARASEPGMIETRPIPYSRERIYREMILVHGVGESDEIGLSPSGTYYEKDSGRALEFEEAWTRFGNEIPRQEHYLRAALELGLALGAGAIWYWTNIAFNSVDWEYDFSLESWRSKLSGEGLRLDDNVMSVNVVSHPFAGAGYHLLARSNGLGLLEAFLLSVATSGIWELLIEYREVVSLNDLVFTPVAGFALGEAMFQLGEFFARGRPNASNRILSWIFGSPARLHDWIDGNRPPAAPTDRFGFPMDVWHRFRLAAGAMHTTAGATRADTSLETEIVSLGAYGREGRVKGLITGPLMTELNLRSTAGAERFLEFMFYAKVAFAGYQHHRVEADSDGDLHGHSFFIGASTSYDYFTGQMARIPDEFGIVNVLGPTIDLTVFLAGARIRATIDVYGNMAAVRSYAIHDYKHTHSLEFESSVLRMHDYYFAFGLTFSGKLTAEFRDFEVGGSIAYHAFDAIQGVSRNQEHIQNEAEVADTHLTARAWLAYTLPGDLFKLMLALEHRSRSGWINDTRRSGSETRVLGQLAMDF